MKKEGISEEGICLFHSLSLLLSIKDKRKACSLNLTKQHTKFKQKLARFHDYDQSYIKYLFIKLCFPLKFQLIIKLGEKKSVFNKKKKNLYIYIRILLEYNNIDTVMCTLIEYIQ